MKINMSTLSKKKILNIYLPNKRRSKSLSQRLIKLEGEINNYTVIVKDFNSPFSVTDKNQAGKKNQ